MGKLDMQGNTDKDDFVYVGISTLLLFFEEISAGVEYGLAALSRLF
ncbi:hypothetical protein SAMN06265795_103160 [Noviherbaspirillum humi]|uniref:Uncharacterized protein n=1 Tax=Noviherbaspirillum humi TaxID=1688639 RepID=A0A239F3Z0_9BURK|nr:hypothetical protein [Noviherbaspirillum humi]SNS51431.1 hypothetical protein SAMN06265795_103160 [Noviherbaspirillum humi]